MKKNGVKGLSKFNKQQLNIKMLDISDQNYQTRKNIKQDTTVQFVFQLTKNENITNHIMSYVVDTAYYVKLNSIYYFVYLVMIQCLKDTIVIIILMQKKQCIVYIMNNLKRILIMMKQQKYGILL